MSKLIGLDYEIQYKKGKEILVVNALSRQHECQVISVVKPMWVQEAIDSYERDLFAQESITKCLLEPKGNGEKREWAIIYKRKIVYW